MFGPDITPDRPLFDGVYRAFAAVPICTSAQFGTRACAVFGGRFAPGSGLLRASRERSAAPIVTMTPSLATARRLALVCVHVVHTSDVADVAEMVDKATRAARDEGFAREGDSILISAGMPFGTPGATNLLRIAQA